MEAQQQQEGHLLPRLRGVYGVERLGGGLPHQQQHHPQHQQPCLRSPGASGPQGGLGVYSKLLLQPKKPWVSWQQQTQQQQPCQQLEHPRSLQQQQEKGFRGGQQPCQQPQHQRRQSLQQQHQEQLQPRLCTPGPQRRVPCVPHQSQQNIEQKQEQHDLLCMQQQAQTGSAILNRGSRCQLQYQQQSTVCASQQQEVSERQQQGVSERQQQEVSERQQQENGIERGTDYDMNTSQQLRLCRSLPEQGKTSSDLTPHQAAHGPNFLRRFSEQQHTPHPHQRNGCRTEVSSSPSTTTAGTCSVGPHTSREDDACRVAPPSNFDLSSTINIFGKPDDQQHSSRLQRKQERNVWEPDDKHPHALAHEPQLQQALLVTQQKQQQSLLSHQRGVLQQPAGRHPTNIPQLPQHSLKQRKEAPLFVQQLQLGGRLSDVQQTWENQQQQHCFSPQGDDLQPLTSPFLLRQHQVQDLAGSTKQQLQRLDHNHRQLHMQQPHTQQPHTQQPRTQQPNTQQPHTQQPQARAQHQQAAQQVHSQAYFEPSARQQGQQQVLTSVRQGGKYLPSHREPEYSLFLRQMQQHEILLRWQGGQPPPDQQQQQRALRELEPHHQVLREPDQDCDRGSSREASWPQQQQSPSGAPLLPAANALRVSPLQTAAAVSPQQVPKALLQQLPQCMLFRQLSDEQRAVVFAPFNADICVVAGPGSGKTRVLAARVALLLLLQPAPVLALTFTRRGAEEMRQRIIAAVSSIAAAISEATPVQPSLMSPGPLCGPSVNSNINVPPTSWASATQATRPATAPHAIDQRQSLSGKLRIAASGGGGGGPASPAAVAAVMTSLQQASGPVCGAAVARGPHNDTHNSSPYQTSTTDELLSLNQQQRLLLSLKTGRVSVCTFHKFCLQFLRQHASKHLHIDSNFRIATPSEQVRLARNVILRFKERLTNSMARSVTDGWSGALSSSSSSTVFFETMTPTSSNCGAGGFPSALLPPTARAVIPPDPGAASNILINKNLEIALSRARACTYKVFQHAVKSSASNVMHTQQQSGGMRGPQQQQPAISLEEDEEGDTSVYDSEEESDFSGGGEGSYEHSAGDERRLSAILKHGGGRNIGMGVLGGGRGSTKASIYGSIAREKGGWAEAEELLKLVRRCKKRGCMAVMPGRRWLERSRASQPKPEQQESGGYANDRRGGMYCYSAAAEEWWEQLQQGHWPAANLVEEYHHVLLSQKPPLLDHHDLIRCTLLLLDWNSAVPKQAARRYPYILVDEFQDTSKEQLRILQLLRTGAAAAAATTNGVPPPTAVEITSGPGATPPAELTYLMESDRATGRGGIMVVGDDDQSIYSFRGIDAKNFVLFEQAYPHALELHLSQNYRCSPAIVSASAALISHNTRRRPKQLRAAQQPALLQQPIERPWSPALNSTEYPSIRRPVTTNVGGGEGVAPGLLPPVMCALLSSPRAEAQYILRFMLAVKQYRRLCWCDFAILSRTNRALKEIEALLTDSAVLSAASCPGVLPYCSSLPVLSSTNARPTSSYQSATADHVAAERAESTLLSSTDLSTTLLKTATADVCAGADGPSPAPRSTSVMEGAVRGGKHQRPQQTAEYGYSPERPPDPALLLGKWWSLLTFPKDIPLRSTAATKLLSGQQLLRRTDTLHCLVYLRLAIDLDHDWSFVKALQLKRIKGVGPAVLKKFDQMLAAVPPDKRQQRTSYNGIDGLGSPCGRRGPTSIGCGSGQLEGSEVGNPLGDSLKDLHPPEELPDNVAAPDRPHSLFRCLCCIVRNAAAIPGCRRGQAKGDTSQKRVKRSRSHLQGGPTAAEDENALQLPFSAAACKVQEPWAPTQEHLSGAVDFPSHQQEIALRNPRKSDGTGASKQLFTKHTVEQLLRLHQELSQLHALTKQHVSAADVLRYILVDLGVEAHIARSSAAGRRKVSTQSINSSTATTTLSSCCSTSSNNPDANGSTSSGMVCNNKACSSTTHTRGEWHEKGASSATGMPDSAEAAAAPMKTRKRRKQSIPTDDKEAQAAEIGSAALHDKLEQVWSLLRTAEAYKPNSAEPLGWHCVRRFLLDISNDFCSGIHPLQHHASRDAVSLSTIHQAKGLEWPVVILCRAHEG